MVWEAIFFLLVLKIPLVYLCWVLWWAIRAQPNPPEPEGALVLAPVEPDPRPGWLFLHRRFRPRRPGPHGSPVRRYGRRATAFARAKVRP